uniref:Nectin cell adhesion molecule 3 n=1 Tax=Knipowitschia caucasica TaxID=637954 RepID=A0AAV2JA52_KNICA
MSRGYGPLQCVAAVKLSQQLLSGPAAQECRAGPKDAMEGREAPRTGWSWRLRLFLYFKMEPKVYVSAGPTALLDGASESLVATCIAERGLPVAEVFWETQLTGRSERQSQVEADGTTSVHLHYMWQPQSQGQGQLLTCVVRHPALQSDFHIPYTLSVHLCVCVCGPTPGPAERLPHPLHSQRAL